MYACESYVGLHAVKDGSFTLHLPSRRALREVFSSQAYAPRDRLVLDMRKGETRLFEYVDQRP